MKPLPFPPAGRHLLAQAGAALASLRWPLPALLGWSAAWAAYLLGLGAGLPAFAAWAGAALLPLPLARRVGSAWRGAVVAAGFPLSTLVLAGSGLPPWAWLLALAALLLLYPLQAWRDAPLFPTAPGALDALAQRLPLPEGPRLLDAGCGLGHGLDALRRAWPRARIEGVERSAVLALAARLRCPWARVRRGDMWAGHWRGYDLVYLFQRPESMARAWRKAGQEMAPGSWLVSLEFEVPGAPPPLALPPATGRPVWAYRVGAQPQRTKADKPDKVARCRVATETS